MSSTSTQRQLCTNTPISSCCPVFTFHFGHCLRQSLSCFKPNLAKVITLAAEWIDTYAIQSWKIVRSRYRKLAWVGLGSITTEFHSDALTDWAISPCVQLCTATPISSLCEVFTFPFCHFICQWLHMLFRAERLLEVGIESWPELDWNPSPLNFIQML